MKSIGVLGAGQLSKLLSLRSKDLDCKVSILSPSNKDPASQNNPLWIKGDPNKQKDLSSFFQCIDIVTFESEFFSTKKLEKALHNVKGKKPYFAPSLKALSLIQDRYTQKKLLSQYEIHTSDFVKVNLKNNSKKKLFELWDKFGPFVLKTRTGAYDGYGTFIFKNKSQIKQKKFVSDSFIAEQFIPFKKELALLAARNKKNQIIFFPLVESFQENSKCLWVKGPTTHKKLKSLKQKIKILLKGIDYQGIIAFELFDTGEKLIVNELAPRVHNSGHYSLNALSEDQFQIHLKAIMNKPLSKPKLLKKAFAMLNLLGESSKKPILKNIKGIHLYWYEKLKSRKGRKMGHLNTTGSSPKQALNKLLKARPHFKV